MGIFDIFKSRKQKESAITKEELEAAGGTDDSGGGGGGSFGVKEADAKKAGIDLSDGVGLDDLGGILKMAFGGGFNLADINVANAGSQEIDLRGSGAREEILEAMRKHGIDTDKKGQTINAGSVPGLQEEIMKILAGRGVNVTGGTIDMRDGDTPDEKNPDANPYAKS